MTYGHSLGIGQADDLAAWFTVHLPMELRRKLMAERPLLYGALFPGCSHAAILDRVAAALGSQAHDHMVKTGRPAAAHLLRLAQGTDHPWEGSDTIDAIEQFLGLFGIAVPKDDDEAAGADAVADAKRLLADRILAAVPAGQQRAAAEDELTSLLYLAEGSLDAAAQAELIRAVAAGNTDPATPAA